MQVYSGSHPAAALLRNLILCSFLPAFIAGSPHIKCICKMDKELLIIEVEN